MKHKQILIITFFLFFAFELVNADNPIKKKLIVKQKRFMQNDNEQESQDNSSVIKSDKLESDQQESDKQESEKQESDKQESVNQEYGNIKIMDEYLLYNSCKELLKPSTAFTVILMIYMVLIIVGAILVIVLLKEELEK